MRNNRWLPILILLLTVGVGIWGGVSLLLKEQGKRQRGKVEADLAKSTTSSALIMEEDVANEKPKVTGILRAHNIDTGSIVLYNINTRNEEGFVYGLSTSVRNRFDREIVMKSLPIGSIIELTFGDDGRLSKVAESTEAWVYEGVVNLKFVEDGRRIRIGEKEYSYDAGITIVNGRELVRLSDLLPEKDVLEVRGIDERILSISVKKGHGSIDFINYDDFIGGSIEIGYEVFEEVRENMSYVLREGSYKLVMENGGLMVNKVIEIERNRIRLLDLAQFKGEMDKNSKVKFSLRPSGASLYLDGREIEAGRTITLPYGEYILKAVKEGFQDFEDRIKLEKPREKIHIRLAAASEEEEGKKIEEEADDGLAEPEEEVDSSEREEVEDREIRVRTDTSGKISFLKPVGATVAFDGREIGVIPCDTVKITGEHEITISKGGYRSLSYTVDIADDGEDAVFSFPELTE